MDLILLNLRPEPEPENQPEAGTDPLPDQETGGSFAGAVAERIFEHCNPFEALGCVLEDPRAAVVLVVLVGAVILAAIILGGLWTGVQEALFPVGARQRALD